MEDEPGGVDRPHLVQVADRRAHLERDAVAVRIGRVEDVGPVEARVEVPRVACGIGVLHPDAFEPLLLALLVAQRRLDDADRRAVGELVRGREVGGVVVPERRGERADVVRRVGGDLLRLFVQEPDRVAQLEHALAQRVRCQRRLPGRPGELRLLLERRDPRDESPAGEHDRLLAVEEPRQRLRGVEPHAEVSRRRQVAQRRISSISSKKPSVS